MLEEKEILEIGVIAKDETITYQEIAKIYGISRERVRQILVKYFPHILEFRKNTKKKLCLRCKKTKSGVYKKNRYGICCVKCYKKAVKNNKKRWCNNYDRCSLCKSTKNKHNSHGVCNGCISKWYYRNDPVRRMQMKEATRRWAKKNPERIRAIGLKAVNKYYDKLKEDPKRYREHLDKVNARYRLRMKDPNKKKKVKDYYKKYNERKTKTIDHIIYL